MFKGGGSRLVAEGEGRERGIERERERERERGGVGGSGGWWEGGRERGMGGSLRLVYIHMGMCSLGLLCVYVYGHA